HHAFGRIDRLCHFIASCLYQQRNALCHAIFVVIQGGMTAALVQTYGSGTAYGGGGGPAGRGEGERRQIKVGDGGLVVVFGDSTELLGGGGTVRAPLASQRQK